MKTLNDAIRQYRRDLSKMQKLRKKSNDLRAKMASIEREVSTISSDLSIQKSVIDFCIETGDCPVVAKLKYTTDQMFEIVNNNKLYAMGTMIGAQGAGPTNYYGPYTIGGSTISLSNSSSVAGAVGTIGPHITNTGNLTSKV